MSDEEKSKLLVTARVSVTVEVLLTQPWNQNVTVDQVYRQAKRSAEEQIHRMIAATPSEPVRVVDMRVVCVSHEVERR